MNPFRELLVKPWLSPGDVATAGSLRDMRAPKIGLLVFFGVVCSLFFLMTIAFLTRMRLDDWTQIPVPWQLWLNTGMLLLGSVSLEYARRSARREYRRGLMIGLLLGGYFAIDFLAGQLWVWRQFSDWGYLVASNPANSFFYLISGVHGLHLLGGLVAWTRAVLGLWRDKPLAEVAATADLCAIYWHFLLGVWLLMLALMTSDKESLELLMAICGL